MPLGRLLTVVVLSPAQAALVAARLIDATRARDAVTGARDGGDRLWSVALTPSGAIEVAPAWPGEGAPVTALLEQLSQNARRLPAHPSPAQVALLSTLEEVVGDRQDDPGDGARRLERALAGLIGPSGEQRLTSDLGALVRAFAHVAPSLPATAGALAASRAPRPEWHRAAGVAPSSDRARPPRFRRHRPARGARSRRVVPVVLLLAAAAAGSGYVVLRDPGTGDSGAVARGTTPTTSPTTAAKDAAKRPRPSDRPEAAALAPRRAGAITGVEVVKTVACTPGAACPVTTTVRFQPSTTARPIVWRVGAAKYCGRGITWSPPITVIAQPGWTSVYASSSAAVPAGRTLALVAVATSPDRAQSPPVPVTGPALRC